MSLLGSLAEVPTVKALWERGQRDNIAVVEKERGDKLSGLEFLIMLSLESGWMGSTSVHYNARNLNQEVNTITL